MACSQTPAVNFDLSQPVPSALSEMSFFTLNNGFPEYSKNVIPYELGAPLFSDYAAKDRAIYLPAGEITRLNGDEVVEFPVGTVLLKSFSYPADLRQPGVGRQMIETRLMIHYDSGWKPFPYV